MHPILESARTIAAALDAVADVSPGFMGTDDQAAALLELATLEGRLTELRLRVLASAGEVAAATGAKDAAGWVAAHSATDFRTARADQRLAEELERHDPVRTALADGSLSLDQARTVMQVLHDLPDDLDPEVRRAALAELVRLGGQHTPRELHKLGAHLLEVVAPEQADELEAQRLARQERRAAGQVRLALTPRGDGCTRLSGLLPDAVASRLNTVLQAWVQPRKAALAADGRALPHSHLMADALGHLLETLDPTRVPLHGGDATTVVVTVTLDQLRRDLGSGLIEGAGFDTGLSATAVRRLACTAGIIPMVLDGAGHVLDLGRTRRLFSIAQRRALRHMHPHCAAQGCTVPAAWCDAHHLRPWAQGGLTDLANGVLLCNHHHHRAHDPDYEMERLPDGALVFRRRSVRASWADPPARHYA